MEKDLIEGAKNTLIAGLYGGEVWALWSVEDENPLVRLAPKDFIQYDANIVSKAVIELLEEGFLKTYISNNKKLYYLTSANEEMVREVWFKYVYKQVDRNLSPILEKKASSIDQKILIKPDWTRD